MTHSFEEEEKKTDMVMNNSSSNFNGSKIYDVR
jgi:hypothetical protein